MANVLEAAILEHLRTYTDSVNNAMSADELVERFGGLMDKGEIKKAAKKLLDKNEIEHQGGCYYVR